MKGKYIKSSLLTWNKIRGQKSAFTYITEHWLNILITKINK